jgi:hypothetical protein
MGFSMKDEEGQSLESPRTNSAMTSAVAIDFVSEQTSRCRELSSTIGVSAQEWLRTGVFSCMLIEIMLGIEDVAAAIEGAWESLFVSCLKMACVVECGLFDWELVLRFILESMK